MYRLSWIHIGMAGAQTEISHPSDYRDGSMVASNTAECCNSIDRPGKWIPNGRRHWRTVRQNYQSCNGNGMSWKPAATGERKIHSQRRKGPGREKRQGSGDRQIREREKGVGEGRGRGRIFLRILSSTPVFLPSCRSS